MVKLKIILSIIFFGCIKEYIIPKYTYANISDKYADQPFKKTNKNINFISEYSDFSQKFNKYIKMLYKKFLNHNKANTTNQQIYSLKKIITEDNFNIDYLENELYGLVSGDFFHKIKNLVKNKLLIKYTCKVTLSTTFPYINFNQNHQNNNSTVINFITTKDIMSEQLFRTYFFLLYIKSKYNYTNMSFSNFIDINIFPIRKSKQIQGNLSPYDINSGCTLTAKEELGKDMFIWRKDEILKVFIHETLHSINYDRKIHLLEPPELFNKLEKINLNEGYNELCAIYIRILIYINKTSKNQNEKQIAEKIHLKLKNELKHSIKNIAKLLLHFNISNFESLLTSDSFKQKSPVFSYIILKTGLLWLFLNKKNSHFLKTIKDLEDFLSLGFISDPNEGFKKLILEIFKNKSFIRTVNDKLNSISRTELDKPFYFTTFHYD